MGIGTATPTTRRNRGVVFGNATVRAYYRHLATVVSVHGVIDGANVDALSDYVRRFTAAGEAVVLDLGDVTSFTGNGMWLLCALDGQCRDIGLQWMLVPGRAVRGVLSVFSADTQFPVAASVPQALHTLAQAIDRRRSLLLPLFKKIA